MKTIKYLMLLAIGAMTFQSCVNEEDALFDKSSAERMNDAIADYTELLESSQNGWIMNFYPTEDGLGGGYVFTATFKNGIAGLAMEVGLSSSTEEWPAGTVVNSLYQVKGEQEALLSFDTYNLLWHFFSEPRGSSSVDGYYNDYEYTFKSVSEDKNTIVLKGKKYGNYMELIRLTDMTGPEYIEKVLENEASFVSRTKIKVGSKEYACTLGDMYFDCEELDISVPYCSTPTGVRLYTPVTIDEVTFQELTLNESTFDLVSKEEASVTFPCPENDDLWSIYPFYFQWTYSGGGLEMCDQLASLLNAGKSISSYSVVYYYLGQNMAKASYDYPYAFGAYFSLLGILNYYGYYWLDFKWSGSQLSFEDLGAGLNWSSTRATYWNPIINFILENAPYDVEYDSAKMATKAKLTSTKDSSVWFTVDRNFSVN